MKASDYVKYDGIGLAELIARREVQASEVAQAAVAAIKATNPAISAVVEIGTMRYHRRRKATHRFMVLPS